LDGAFVLFDFERLPPVVHLEHKISSIFLEKPDQVDLFRREADTLARSALSPAESMELISRVAVEHERE
jgi:hypothetical protein